ncbi:hypothetical protein C8J57DRAFT_1515981 [Mycena rebaudengoi]|nr:hypothetical protein C8J57DRAFT_1515981 [Mycena rebaudengoi]
MLAVFVLCLLKVQPATSKAISLDARTPLGGFGYVHGYTNEDVTEAGSPTDEEMEKRAPLGGFGYVYGYTNEDVTEGSPIAPSVEGRAPFGLAA